MTPECTTAWFNYKEWVNTEAAGAEAAFEKGWTARGNLKSATGAVKQCFQCKEPVAKGTPLVYLDTGEIHFNDTSAPGANL